MKIQASYALKTWEVLGVNLFLAGTGRNVFLNSEIKFPFTQIF